MTITSRIRAYLLADGGLATEFGTRIYPMQAPQGATYPLVVLTKISGARIGSLADIETLARPRYQVDVWVENTGAVDAYSEVERLGGLVRQRLSDQTSGAWIETEASPGLSINVQIEFINDLLLTEGDVNGGYVRHSADYFVWHQTAGGVY